MNNEEKSLKPVHIINKRAISLIHKRAEAEGRSLANAAARIIIEALEPKEHPETSSEVR